jgi:hypothetical protein
VVKLFVIGRVGGVGASTDRARVTVAKVSVIRGGTVVTTVVLAGTGTESGVVTLFVIGACVGGGVGAGIVSVTRVVVTAVEVVGTGSGVVVALFFVVLVVGARASGVVLVPLSLNTDDS